MPFPNEHSCRLEDPKNFERFTRQNCAARSNGKCLDYIFGILEGKSKLQAIRYDKERWSINEAREHCKEKDGTFEAALGKNMTMSKNNIVQELKTKELKEQKKMNF